MTIIILACLVIATSWIYFTLKSAQNINPTTTQSASLQATSTPTRDSTANCGNFTNQQYGFKFECPLGWVMVGQPVTDSDSTVMINFASPETQQGPKFSTYGGDLNIYIYNNPANLSLMDFFSDKPGMGPNLIGGAQSGTKNIIIDSQHGLRLYDVTGESTTQIALFPNSDNTKLIEVEDSSKAVIIDQILATFKFISTTTASSTSSDTKNVITSATELPPDPGVNGKMTVVGIDSDNDGIRDDIQRYIALTYPNSEKTRASMTQYAAAIQDEITAKTSADISQGMNAEIKAIDCALFLNTSAQTDTLLAQILNTPARSKAYITAVSESGGQTIRVTPANQRKAQCTFNPDLMKN